MKKFGQQNNQLGTGRIALSEIYFVKHREKSEEKCK